MASDLFPHDHAALVARLRAAGCVYAEDEAALLTAATDSPQALTALTDRRVAGEPLEHLLGWAEFCAVGSPSTRGCSYPGPGLRCWWRPPRRSPGPAPALVDLCCGSGAISVALIDRLAPRWLAAVDVDPAAVACARRNLAGRDVTVVQGDLYDPLLPDWRGRLDVVVANAPYVPTPAVALMPAEARLHEASVALDGGGDGLAVLRRVAAGAVDWLRPGGHLVVEVSAGQAGALCEEMTGLGLLPTVLSAEESARPRRRWRSGDGWW